MPAPNSIPCSVVDCEYTTPAGCPTWDLLRDFLEQHRESVHPAANGPRIGPFYSIESTYVRLYGQWAPHLAELHEG